MSGAVERQCTVLLPLEGNASEEATDLAQQLEKGDTESKIEAMKKIVRQMLNGEQLGHLLMHVIRFVIPHEDHQCKKLVYLYLEVVDKTGADGKLLPEMILVCNMLRNDLNHANEFVRGCSLRFLSKLKEPEILEPLVPSIRTNLEHRHSYVRRNAVLAIYNAFRTHEDLVPDAPDLIENFLLTESDSSAKRNAFLMLVHSSQDRAVDFVLNVIDQISTLGDIIQLVMLELVRKVCRADPLQKGRYMQAMVSLLASQSPSVTFECCGTLVSLSSNPHVVRAATQSYCQLLGQHSDNNVKLVVLDRLTELKANNSSILQECLMDIMRGLSSPNIDIKKKILDLALDLVNPRNIEAVVGVLKKEVMKTQNDEAGRQQEYRSLLINTIHNCVIRFPEVADGVAHILLDFVGDTNVTSANDVILFLREVIESYPHLREGIISRLLATFPDIRAGKVFRVALWIFSEYCETADEQLQAIEVIKASMGELPFITEEEEEANTAAGDEPQVPVGRPRVLADGTYASETIDAKPKVATSDSSNPSLRSLLLGGDFFLGAVIASSITKMVMRLALADNVDNRRNAEMMMYMVALVKLGQKLPQKIDDDASERICMCMTMIADLHNTPLTELWTKATRLSFANMLKATQEEEKKLEVEKSEKLVRTQADDLISIRQLRGKQAQAFGGVDDDDMDLIRATGATEGEEDFASRLKRIQQLTGLSDPVYAEAVVTVLAYDIVLDVLIINQTDETLHSVCLELSTVGDLKICERPQTYTLAPRAQLNVRVNLKVSSTETGIIYGNIVFETAAARAATSNVDNRNVVILTDLHIDVMDYITPAHCKELQYRVMWAEFEWENKISVNTTITDPLTYLQHVIKCTNMRCLTPESALQGNCSFLAANLYAKSIFGEDALVNVSLEKPREGAVIGSIRIRSKTQGIALSLGDKITVKQKDLKD